MKPLYSFSLLSSTFIKRTPFFYSTTRTMSTHTHLTDECVFCKIIKGDIPSFKLVETDKCYSFIDIEPLSDGHSLVIPKYHAEFMHQLPDEYLTDILPIAKQIAKAAKFEQYNVLQNNGKRANQAVPHVHFHVINKPNATTGVGLTWKPINTSMDSIKAHYEEIKKNL
ncbi:HIT-like protein [Halteromyces radiatus]|uniref:HIT-like protein n=1 Tax=Halteromyces radiatus TaxID=101107 RepID=UPI0022209ADA|nr:HIT-like protein [Halteromyces radiatus]KAI8093480.1 HIT-like protein [Halteromyces radiatus]